MKRPDGSGQMTASYWLFGISLCCAGGAFLIKVVDWTGDIDPEALAMRWLMGIASGGMFSLGFVLLSVGWIIRAIYFLPGREMEETEEAQATAPELLKPINPKVSAAVILIAIAVLGLFAQSVLTSK